MDLSAALGTITEYTYQLGHDTTETIGDEDDGAEFRGFNVQHHTGYHYTTIVADDRAYGFVHFEFDIRQNIARKFATESDQPLQKANAILDERYMDQLEDCRPRLREILYGGDSIGEIQETENGTIQGFTVNRRYYPTSDDFSLARYGDCVREVVSTGRAAFEHLATHTEVLGDEIDATAVDSARQSRDVRKGFQ